MSRPTRRRKRGTGHELRDVIIREATDLLARAGDTEALTMRAVAAAAAVTAPSVYRHFPDKKTLVRAVVEQQFRQFNEVLAAATEADTAPAFTRLSAMAQAYVAWGLRHPGHYRVLFSATNAGPAGLGLPVDVEHPGAASFQTLLDAVTACLEPPGHASALTLATQLWASLHGIVDLRITKPELPWPPAEDLVDLSLTAIHAAQPADDGGSDPAS